MPEDKNTSMPEENLEPEEPKDLQAEEGLTPGEPAQEAEGTSEEMELKKEEEVPEEPSEGEEPMEGELSEEGPAGEEETPEETGPEELLEEEALELEEGPPAHRKGRMSWWVIVLVLIIIVSVANTLWNKIEAKLDSVNESVVSQTQALENIKAEFAKLQEVADQQEVRINKAERYIRSIRNNMTDLDQKAESTITAAKRHDDWIRKDLERKKQELAELSALITAQESILNGDAGAVVPGEVKKEETSQEEQTADSCEPEDPYQKKEQKN
ncbi:MAG: hypothetical protein JW971_08365 [Synergistales bacterium]|nr:hypothetical protein [Synergistales bacterium]